jgi:hypothetical protein
VHGGAFCQFPFRWNYYYGSNEFTGKDTGKMHLCAVVSQLSGSCQLSVSQQLVVSQLSAIGNQVICKSETSCQKKAGLSIDN